MEDTAIDMCGSIYASKRQELCLIHMIWAYIALTEGGSARIGCSSELHLR